VFVIWGAACGVALVILFASYSFHQSYFGKGCTRALAGLRGRDCARCIGCLPHKSADDFPRQSAVDVDFCPRPGGVRFVKRARYFGNVQPLAIAALSAGPGQWPLRVFWARVSQNSARVSVCLSPACFADLLETAAGLPRDGCGLVDC